MHKISLIGWSLFTCIPSNLSQEDNCAESPCHAGNSARCQLLETGHYQCHCFSGWHCRYCDIPEGEDCPEKLDYDIVYTNTYEGPNPLLDSSYDDYYEYDEGDYFFGEPEEEILETEAPVMDTAETNPVESTTQKFTTAKTIQKPTTQPATPAPTTKPTTLQPTTQITTTKPKTTPKPSPTTAVPKTTTVKETTTAITTKPTTKPTTVPTTQSTTTKPTTKAPKTTQLPQTTQLTTTKPLEIEISSFNFTATYQQILCLNIHTQMPKDQILNRNDNLKCSLTWSLLTFILTTFTMVIYCSCSSLIIKKRDLNRQELNKTLYNAEEDYAALRYKQGSL